MNYLLVLFGVCFLKLLLKINWMITVGLSVFFFGMVPIHQKKARRSRLQKQRFEDVCLYMDCLLYAFQKSGKIDAALADVAATLKAGSLKTVVLEAYDYLLLTFDETKVMEEALRRIEKEYPCKRLRDIHDFLLHVEYYGGEVDRPIQLLLEDKARWESRTKEAMEERKKMWIDIVLSVMVSVAICGVIMYLPVMNVDISANPLTQILTVVVLLLDEIILLKGQKYLEEDWLSVDQVKEESYYEKKMEEYQKYDEKKEKRKSWILSGFLAGLCVFLWLKTNEWVGMIGLAMVLFCANQYKIGRNLAKKTIVKGIQCAFPVWLMDLVLLLQSENVQVALEKSKMQVPGIFRMQLEDLLGELEINPESSEPYHHFLQEFDLPEIKATMSMLYALSIGSHARSQTQIEQLIDRNQKMLDQAQQIRMKDKNSGMYLLFLAPVLTASLKLVTDMAVFMLTFLSVATL